MTPSSCTFFCLHRLDFLVSFCAWLSLLACATTCKRQVTLRKNGRAVACRSNRAVTDGGDAGGAAVAT
eukprot:11491587-Prorocentrum_lima.AAC.1